MQINKRDLLTIILLCTIFFTMATWSLGFTQTPTTTTQFSPGQSLYLDLGTSSNVGSIYFLLKDGAFNLTIYRGSPENWQLTRSQETFSDYYKWKEIGIHQTTQFIRVDFSRSNQSSTDPIIAEVAVTNSGGQQIPITNIVNFGSGNPNLQNLIDEQNKVELPPTYMSQTYFDEIYFVRTSEQYLNPQWHQLPYEWTHPPLGKLIQASGITVFGFSPFGWRIMGVIFGTLMIVVMYLLGKQLFGTWIGAFASAFLLTFDFMHFTMARMGTADTYVVFFSLISQLFFLIYFMNIIKKGWKTSVVPLFLAVIFFMLGFSTKWLVLYAAVGMLAMLAVLRIKDIRKLEGNIGRKYAAFFDHPFLLLLGFIAIAIGIYFAIYIPDMIIGRPLLGTYGNGVIDLQFAMYNYHATLTATHNFASPWWSWPLMLNPLNNAANSQLPAYVPLWLDITYLPNNIDSTISVMGNPAVWWVGSAAIIIVTERAIRGKELLLSLTRKISKKPKKPDPQVQMPSEITASALVTEKPSTTLAPILETTEVPAQSSSRSWDLPAIFIATIFFFSWIPYVFISRVTFIYHFYVAMPFLSLASAYFINKYWNTRVGKVATLVFFAIVIVLFIVFYPVISGVPVETSWIYKLKWFPSWFFAP